MNSGHGTYASGRTGARVTSAWKSTAFSARAGGAHGRSGGDLRGCDLRGGLRDARARGGYVRGGHLDGAWRRLFVAWGVALVFGVLGVVGAGCRGEGGGAEQDLVGSVQRFPIDSDNWVLIADSAPSEIYVPDALPEPFREAGLRVRFAIERLEPSPNVRMVGIPVRLLRITREEVRSRS